MATARYCGLSLFSMSSAGGIEGRLGRRPPFISFRQAALMEEDHLPPSNGTRRRRVHIGAGCRTDGLALFVKQAQQSKERLFRLGGQR